MKLRMALFGLLIAFPLLYVGGAVLRSGVISTIALLFVAGVCLVLLRAERKT